MASGTSRREFNKSAALLGLGGWAGAQLLASQASAAGAGAAGPVELAQASTASPGGTVPLAPPDRQPPDLVVPEPVARKVGYAVVGLGALALEEVMPAFRECRMSRPVALVSGHPDKARKVAEVYGIESNAIYDYDGFDRISADGRIDAVYVILPNSMHAEFTIRAFRAGKHVLCEKPMAVTPEECERMIAAASDARRKLMIAYRLHYEPFNRKVMELCAQQALGQVKTFTSSNCQNTPAPNIRLSRATGGGPVGDVGVYSINAARYVFGEEPVEVAAVAQQPAADPRFREVPESVAFTLRYPSGGIAQCDCSFGTGVDRQYRVHCAQGLIEMDPAFSYRGLRLRVQQGNEKQGDKRDAELLLEEVNQFSAEIDHFSDCVLNNRNPQTPGEMGLADMRIVAAIDEAVRTGRWVKVARS